jgi:chromosome segregation ATPase
MITNNSRDDSGIVFDAKSGISEEEQREILAKINNIAEKNRLSLAEGEKGEGKGKKTRFKAKKSGGRFPIIVNIIAFTALAGGLIILISMQGKTDARIRTGTRVYNSAERALIEEIRRETQSAATDELERLNREQSKAAAVEAQMSGFFSNLNRQITNSDLDEAAVIIKTMREFINTPAFGTLRPIQARKEMYTQAINSFETMIDETRKYKTNSGAGGNINTNGLQARITQLEQNLAEKDKTIAAFSSQGTSATRRLTELENNNKTLQTRNTQLQTDLDKQTRSATTLQQNLTQTTAQLQQAASDLQTERARTTTLTQTVNSRDATIQQRDNSIRELQQRINRIQEVVQGKAAVNMTIGELSDSVSRIQEVLGVNQ